MGSCYSDDHIAEDHIHMEPVIYIFKVKVLYFKKFLSQFINFLRIAWIYHLAN